MLEHPQVAVDVVAFDLMRRGGRAPQEPLGKAGGGRRSLGARTSEPWGRAPRDYCPGRGQGALAEEFPPGDTIGRSSCLLMAHSHLIAPEPTTSLSAVT